MPLLARPWILYTRTFCNTNYMTNPNEISRLLALFFFFFPQSSYCWKFYILTKVEANYTKVLCAYYGNVLQEVDDLMLRRFLRARDWDIEKGSNMFLKYLKWRRSFVPNGSISPSEIPNEIAQNKMFLQGFDKKGRPIGVAFGARHFQNKRNPEEFKRMLFYLIITLKHINSPLTIHL